MSTIVSGFIAVEPGVELFYQEAGQGPVILMTPGLTFSSDVFCRQLQCLSDRYRVIAFDPRGQGRSSKVLHGNDTTTHARDLGVLIGQLGLSEIALVGWSFGALTTWRYLEDDVSRVIAHIAIDVPPKPLSANEADWSEGAFDEVATWYNTHFTDQGALRAFMRAYATGAMVERPLEDNELEWILAQSAGTPAWVAAALFASGLFMDLRPAVRSSSDAVDTLVILAESWSAKALPYMRALAPRARIESMGAHMMFWEHYQRFNTLLDAFLSQARANATKGGRIATVKF